MNKAKGGVRHKDTPKGQGRVQSNLKGKLCCARIVYSLTCHDSQSVARQRDVVIKHN